MSRLPKVGGDNNVWGSILNDFLSVEHNADGTQKTLDISKGGTGATDVTSARNNLGLNGTNVYVQNSTPTNTPSTYLWIQTALGSSGHDMTFWVEDGQ